MTINKPEIGYGIYTYPDVAAILDLPGTMVRRWINDFWDIRFIGNELKRYSWGDGREKYINFLTLIEFYTFFRLRELKISTQKIIKAHQLIG